MINSVFSFPFPVFSTNNDLGSNHLSTQSTFNFSLNNNFSQNQKILLYHKVDWDKNNSTLKDFYQNKYSNQNSVAKLDDMVTELNKNIDQILSEIPTKERSPKNLGLPKNIRDKKLNKIHPKRNKNYETKKWDKQIKDISLLYPKAKWKALKHK